MGDGGLSQLDSDVYEALVRIPVRAIPHELLMRIISCSGLIQKPYVQMRVSEILLKCWSGEDADIPDHDRTMELLSVLKGYPGMVQLKDFQRAVGKMLKRTPELPWVLVLLNEFEGLLDIVLKDALWNESRDNLHGLLQKLPEKHRPLIRRMIENAYYRDNPGKWELENDPYYLQEAMDETRTQEALHERPYYDDDYY